MKWEHSLRVNQPWNLYLLTSILLFYNLFYYFVILSISFFVSIVQTKQSKIDARVATQGESKLISQSGSWYITNNLKPKYEK